jgi:hypothetical protein
MPSSSEQPAWCLSARSFRCSTVRRRWLNAWCVRASILWLFSLLPCSAKIDLSCVLFTTRFAIFKRCTGLFPTISFDHPRQLPSTMEIMIMQLQNVDQQLQHLWMKLFLTMTAVFFFYKKRDYCFLPTIVTWSSELFTRNCHWSMKKRFNLISFPWPDSAPRSCSQSTRGAPPGLLLPVTFC